MSQNAKYISNIKNICKGSLMKIYLLTIYCTNSNRLKERFSEFQKKKFRAYITSKILINMAQ